MAVAATAGLVDFDLSVLAPSAALRTEAGYTFAPTRNPSFDYELELVDVIDSTQFGRGYAQTLPHLLRPLRRARLNWNVLTKDDRDYIEDFFYRVRGQVFNWVPLDEDFSPLAIPPTLSQTSGGSLSSRTYSVKYTYFNSIEDEETKPSPAKTLLVAANSLLKVEVPVFPPSADMARIYAVATPGTETLQASTTARTWTEPTTGLVSGAALPTTNTLKTQLLWRIEATPRFRKFKANRYSAQLQLLEQVVT